MAPHTILHIDFLVEIENAIPALPNNATEEIR